MGRRRVRVRRAVFTAVLASLLAGVPGVAAADGPSGSGSVATPDGLSTVDDVPAPTPAKPAVTPPRALRDQPAGPPTIEPLDPATAAALTSTSCAAGTCLELRPATAATASLTRAAGHTRAAGPATAGVPIYGPPECAFAPDAHVGYWRYNPNRMMSCRSITHPAEVVIYDQDGEREVIGTEIVNVNEWFSTAYNSMTITHGVMFEALYVKGVTETHGIGLTAPYPCPLSVPAGRDGCRTSSTGLAVNIEELPEHIARAFQWTETMVLGGTDRTQLRLLFNDFLTVTASHPASPARPPATFDGTDEFRCDNQSNVRGAGCVNPRFAPTVTFDDTQYHELAPVTHHIRLAQDQLPDHPGRPGDAPFMRVAGGSQEALDNRNRACDNNTDFRYDGAGTECDEYPFATTLQSSTSAFSAMPVPSAANSRQGTVLSDGILKNRITVDDTYYVVAKTGSARSGSPARNSTLNTQFTSYGDNAGCADWSGGDATNSVQIPGTSKRAWFFSDSYLGSPSARRNLFATSAIRNSIVVQDGSAMRTITGGNTCQEMNQDIDFFKRYAKTPAADPDGGFFWTGDQVASGGDVVKFYYHGRPTDESWVNDYAAVATLSGPALSAASTATDPPTMTIKPVKLSCASGGPDAMWGTMVTKWSDNNYYIYGTGASVPHQLYLARASAANLTNFSGWQFFAGSDLRTATGSGTATWTTCAGAKALPIGYGATGGSVDYLNGTVWLIQDDYVNPNSFSVGTLSAHPSQTPWGFTDRRIPLYDPPEGTHTYPYYHWVYEPRIQDGLTSGANLVLSYNVNTDARDTGCVDANNWDGHIYRPRFVNIPTSWLNTYDAAYMSTGRYSYPGETPAREVATSIGGATDWSPGGLGANSCPAVNPASNFTVAPRTNGTVDMSWTVTGNDVWTYLWQCDSTVTTCGTTPDCTSGAAGFTKQFDGLWLTVQSINLAPIQIATQNGHTFRWYVCSSAARGGRGGPSAIAAATVTVPVPPAPADLRLIARSGTLATLAWNEVTFPSASVYITPYYWDITAGGTPANAIAGTPQAGGITMTTTVPDATHTYGFYLRASNVAGIGPASNQVQG